MKACMATNNGQIVGIYSVTSELIKELRKGKDASSNYSMYIAGTYSVALVGCSPVYVYVMYICIYIYIYNFMYTCIYIYVYSSFASAECILGMWCLFCC